jgi:hypothetical protein
MQIGPSVTRFNSPRAWWNRCWIGRICSDRANHQAQAERAIMHKQIEPSTTSRVSPHAQAEKWKLTNTSRTLLRPRKPVATALLPLDLSPHDPQLYSVRPTCEGSTSHDDVCDGSRHGGCRFFLFFNTLPSNERVQDMMTQLWCNACH